LQPIETIWAIVKEKVSRQYNDATTMQDVKQRLYAAFASLTSKSVAGCINYAHLKTEELTVRVKQEAKDLLSSEHAPEDEIMEDVIRAALELGGRRMKDAEVDLSEGWEEPEDDDLEAEVDLDSIAAELNRRQESESEEDADE